MAEHLFLRIDGDADSVTALALDSEGRLLARPERIPLAAAVARAGEMSLTVLLPASEFVNCVAKLPAATPARMRQMLPFTLEDEFAGDIDELHFAAGARNDDDLLAVSVIARERLDHYLGVLASAGLQARHICSEADAVPDTPEVVTLFVEPQQILGRRPGGAPFAFSELSLGDLWTLLEHERSDGEDLKRVVLFIDPNTRRARADEIDAWRGTLDELDIKELADGCLPRMAANLVHRPGTNLLQGPYATRSNVAALARPWRTAAGFLVALTTLVLLGKAAAVWKLSADVDRIGERIAAVCAESYATSQLNGCRLEMLRRLEGAGQAATSGGPGYLATLATIAEAGGGALGMQQMSYSDGVMRLEFIAPSVPFVDTFSQAVMRGGQFQVVDQQTRTEPEGVGARLSIVAQDR